MGVGIAGSEVLGSFTQENPSMIRPLFRTIVHGFTAHPGRGESRAVFLNEQSLSARSFPLLFLLERRHLSRQTGTCAVHTKPGLPDDRVQGLTTQPSTGKDMAQWRAARALLGVHWSRQAAVTGVDRKVKVRRNRESNVKIIVN